MNRLDRLEQRQGAANLAALGREELWERFLDLTMRLPVEIICRFLAGARDSEGRALQAEQIQQLFEIGDREALAPLVQAVIERGGAMERLRAAAMEAARREAPERSDHSTSPPTIF